MNTHRRSVRANGRITVHDGVIDVVIGERAAHEVLATGAMNLVILHWPRRALTTARDGAVQVRDSGSVPLDHILGATGAGNAMATGVLPICTAAGGSMRRRRSDTVPQPTARRVRMW